MHESACMLVDMWGSGGSPVRVGAGRAKMGRGDIGRLVLLRRPRWWWLGGRSSLVGIVHLHAWGIIHL